MKRWEKDNEAEAAEQRLRRRRKRRSSKRQRRAGVKKEKLEGCAERGTGGSEYEFTRDECSLRVILSVGECVCTRMCTILHPHTHTHIFE